MKSILFSILVISTILISCDKGVLSNDCISDVLDEYGMVEYTGQEKGCKLFMHLYDWNGKPYFLLDNYCADMKTAFFDCEGNQICTELEADQDCLDFYNEASEVKVIGIVD